MLMTIAQANDADGFQQEPRHLTLSVAGNNTTRTMLRHHALFVLSVKLRQQQCNCGGY